MSGELQPLTRVCRRPTTLAAVRNKLFLSPCLALEYWLLSSGPHFLKRPLPQCPPTRGAPSQPGAGLHLTAGWGPGLLLVQLELFRGSRSSEESGQGLRPARWVKPAFPLTLPETPAGHRGTPAAPGNPLRPWLLPPVVLHALKTSASCSDSGEHPYLGSCSLRSASTWGPLRWPGPAGPAGDATHGATEQLGWTCCRAGARPGQLGGHPGRAGLRGGMGLNVCSLRNHATILAESLHGKPASADGRGVTDKSQDKPRPESRQGRESP